MFSRFRSRTTYANVVASLALFVALGGGAYAAVELPKNSVGREQIKHAAVNSPKVKNRSLKAIDFAVGELPAGTPAPGDGKIDYGVARVFARSAEIETMWTGDVPDDGTNAATSSVHVPYVLQPGAGRTITLRGVARSDETTGGQMGVVVIVRNSAGQIVAFSRCVPWSGPS